MLCFPSQIQGARQVSAADGAGTQRGLWQPVGVTRSCDLTRCQPSDVEPADRLTSRPSGRAQMGHGSGFRPPVDLSWDCKLVFKNRAGMRCSQSKMQRRYRRQTRGSSPRLAESWPSQVHLLQIREVQELAEFLLQLGFAHCPVVYQLHSVLLHLKLFLKNNNKK